MLFFIADRELSLRLLVGSGKGLKLLHRVGLDDFNAKLDIAFGVLMPGLDVVSDRRNSSILDVSAQRLWSPLEVPQEFD